jgi:hypothetical protein
MAIINIPELVCDPGAENEFSATDTFIFDAYTPGDWDGSEASHCKFYSDTPGPPAVPSHLDLQTIGNITVHNVDFTNIHVINGTIVCID